MRLTTLSCRRSPINCNTLGVYIGPKIRSGLTTKSKSDFMASRESGELYES